MIRTTLAVVVALALPVGASAAPCVLIADEGYNAIVQVNLADGAITYLAQNGYLDDPSGLYVDTDGTIVVADSAISGYPDPDRSPIGGLLRVDPTTGAQTIISARGNLLPSMETPVPGADGMIYVADWANLTGAGGVVRVDPATGEQTAVSLGGAFVATFALAFDLDGNLLVTDAEDWWAGTGALYRVDVKTGAQALVSRGGLFRDPFGVAALGDGRIVVGDMAGRLILVTPDGGQTLLAEGGLLVSPAGIYAQDGWVYVADFHAGSVDGGVLLRVNVTTGLQEMLAKFRPYSSPVGIAPSPVCYPGGAVTPTPSDRLPRALSMWEAADAVRAAGGSPLAARSAALNAKYGL